MFLENFNDFRTIYCTIMVLKLRWPSQANTSRSDDSFFHFVFKYFCFI